MICSYEHLNCNVQYVAEYERKKIYINNNRCAVAAYRDTVLKKEFTLRVIRRIGLFLII